MRQVLSGLVLALALLPGGASGQMVGGPGGVWHPPNPVYAPDLRASPELMRNGTTTGPVQIRRPSADPDLPHAWSSSLRPAVEGRPPLAGDRGNLSAGRRAETATITYDAATRTGSFTTSAGTCSFGLLVLDRPHLPKEGVPVAGPLTIQCPPAVGTGGGSWVLLPDRTILVHVKTNTGAAFNVRLDPSGR